MLQDVRFGLRGLRLNPGFTALAALTLAVGLGACLAIFSIVNGVLLRPLPYPHPERVVSIWEVGKEGTESPVAFPNFEDWHSQARGFEAMAAYAGGETPILIGRQAVRADAYVATEDFFRVLGVEPFIGRSFQPEDAHAAPVAVVSHGFWLNALGAPADLSGQTITVDEDVCELVGVMPPDFAYPAAADIWVANTVRRQWGSRTAHNVRVIGRLRPDVPFAAAQEEMHVIAARLKTTYPDNDAFSARLIDLRDTLVTDTRKPLYLLMGAVLLILLTACANLASTLLARATRRQREMAIRASLGADRGRLVRQLLAESLVLAAIGGAGGLLVARLLMPILVGLAPTSLPRAGEIHVDGLVTLVALGLSLVTSVLVGLAPALHASRANLATALADTSRGATAQHSSRARATLVAAEVAVAFVLLVGAGLLIKSFAAVLSQPLGFNPSHVLTVNIALPGATYGGAGRQPQVVAFHDRLLEATRALRGVETVGLTTSLPLARAPNGKFAVADRYGAIRRRDLSRRGRRPVQDAADSTRRRPTVRHDRQGERWRARGNREQDSRGSLLARSDPNRQARAAARHGQIRPDLAHRRRRRRRHQGGKPDAPAVSGDLRLLPAASAAGALRDPRRAHRRRARCAGAGNPGAGEDAGARRAATVPDVRRAHRDDGRCRESRVPNAPADGVR